MADDREFCLCMFALHLAAAVFFEVFVFRVLMGVLGVVWLGLFYHSMGWRFGS